MFKWIRKLRPIFYENSKIPVLLSKISPIEIGAISLGPFVFSRGKISKKTMQHETIHFQQQIETLFIGFFLLYGIFWLRNYIKYKNGKEAYFEIPFEIEAYAYEDVEGYLESRPFYSWRFFL